MNPSHKGAFEPPPGNNNNNSIHPPLGWYCLTPEGHEEAMKKLSLACEIEKLPIKSYAG